MLMGHPVWKNARISTRQFDGEHGTGQEKVICMRTGFLYTKTALFPIPIICTFGLHFFIILLPNSF